MDTNKHEWRFGELNHGGTETPRIWGAVAGARNICGALLFAASALAAPAEESPRREAAECRVRGGLPNAVAKAKAGGEVRVAYLGGSITAAPGWRPMSLAWLKAQYPAASFEEINAAIGGTGSDLGVYRLGFDVLRHKPDLLFVEFAVNDGGAEPARIHRAMEGIVRQAWKADPATDICFVYTVSEPFLQDLLSNLCSRAATAMEEVADHYGIPSIHLGVDVARRVTEGRLVFKGTKTSEGPMVFSEDGVHPLVETGHELYLEAIARSWSALCVAGSAGPHAVPPPLRADNLELARMAPVTQAMLTGPWEKLDAAKDDRARSFQNRMPVLWKATGAGATLTFAFRGTAASLYDLLGPDGGQLSVRVDDGPERKVARIDGYCTYHRIARLDLAADLPEGTHRVTVTLLPDAPDKAKILFENNRPDLEKNPAKYATNSWHVSSVLVAGDVIEP
jgi:hypothetical protein